MTKASWLLGNIVMVGGLLVGACSDSNNTTGGGGRGGSATGVAGRGGSGGGGTAGGAAGNAGAAGSGVAGSGVAGSGVAGGGGAGGGGAAGSGGAAGVPPTCAEIPSMASGSTTFTITSSGFASCAAIPAASTCDAKPFPQGTSPALSWTAGPTGTMSYAIVFKDLSVLARTASTDPNYNRGYHYVMWDIPASVTSLPAAMAGGFAVPNVPGALQWSNFNDYGFFGPCPNFDPAMPTDFNDVYSFQIYALPFAKAAVPAAMMGVSTVRLLDNVFKPAALAVAEYRGTSNAHASEIPAGVLPPTAKPPCASATGGAGGAGGGASGGAGGATGGIGGVAGGTAGAAGGSAGAAGGTAGAAGGTAGAAGGAAGAAGGAGGAGGSAPTCLPLP